MPPASSSTTCRCVASNFRTHLTLSDYLKRENTVAIADIDTRKLTRLLRTKGAQNGCLMALEAGQEITPEIVEQAVALARQAPAMNGLDLAKVVTTDKTYGWDQTEWELGAGYGQLDRPRYHVVAYDFGVKKQHPAHAGRARLPGHRGAGADPGRRSAGSSSRTASSSPTAPAIPSPATTRSRRRAS